jgi:hypothetical protein
VDHNIPRADGAASPPFERRNPGRREWLSEVEWSLTADDRCPHGGPMDEHAAGPGSAVILHGVPVHGRFDRPAAEAVAIRDGRVTAIGSLGEVRAKMPLGTVERRLLGGALLPAFVDPHQHAYLVASDPGSDALYRQAQDIRGLVDLVARLLAEGVGGSGEGWARLHGYEPLRLAERRSPTAAELDRAMGDRPLHVLSRTFHESVVNSPGLDALGIGRRTADPSGGRIVRDRKGQPTGVLLEAASFAAEAASRAPDNSAAWGERIRAHGRRLLSLGIVRIGDAAVPAPAADALVAEFASVGVAAYPLLVGERIDAPAIVPGATAKVLLDGGEYCHLRFTSRLVSALMAASFRANVGQERALARTVGLRAGWPELRLPCRDPSAIRDDRRRGDAAGRSRTGDPQGGGARCLNGTRREHARRGGGPPRRWRRCA